MKMRLQSKVRQSDVSALRAAALALVVLLGLGSACGGDGGGSGGSDDPEPSKPRKPPPAEQAWTTRVIVDSDAGQHIELRYDSRESRPTLAYYATVSTDDGPCVEIGNGVDVPTRNLWELFYGEERGGSWEFETVVQTLSQSAPRGLGYAVAPDGTQLIAAITGPPIDMPRYCGAHDLGVFTRDAPGSWSEETAVVTSGEAASGEPASDAGQIVGYWPSLAFAPSGQAAIAYRDVHFGGIQNDDFERADLELALGNGGSWQALPVEVGVGAGQENHLLFDPDGRIVIVHVNPVMQELENRNGLWVSRSDDDGSTWEHVRIFSAPVINAPSAIYDAEGVLTVAYYDPGRGVPVVATLSDDSQFSSAKNGWQEQTVGDARYDEGYDPSLALDEDGRLGLAYYRCTGTESELGDCNPADDALVLLHRAAGETEFTVETVDEGETLGSCGRYPSLIFEGAGKAAVAYACEGNEGQSLVEQLRFARREAF